MTTESGLTVTQATGIVIAAITIVGVVTVALLIILSKRREEIQVSTDRLLGIRDTELEDCNKKCTDCKEELEDVTAEFRALSGVNIEKLVSYWKDFEEHQLEVETLKRKIRVLERANANDLSDPPNK